MSVLTGFTVCLFESQRILRNWVIQNWFYNYRRIPWKKTESKKKAESAGDDWRYTKGQLNPLYNGPLGRTEQSDHWLKQEWAYGLSAKKNGRCREVAVSGDSAVVDNTKGETLLSSLNSILLRQPLVRKTKTHIRFPLFVDMRFELCSVLYLGYIVLLPWIPLISCSWCHLSRSSADRRS